MAIFAKDNSDRGDRYSSPGAAGDSPLSIISAGMIVTGNIESTGVVKVEGRIEGSIRGARQVLLGRQGEVKGDIHAQEAVIGGRVEGMVRTSDRVEVQGSATVTGDIHTKTIIVLEGAQINGHVRMSDAVAANDAPSAGVAIVR
jgi:cytoskeletal protein CcmA (bactofilin family)